MRSPSHAFQSLFTPHPTHMGFTSLRARPASQNDPSKIYMQPKIVLLQALRNIFVALQTCLFAKLSQLAPLQGQSSTILNCSTMLPTTSRLPFCGRHSRSTNVFNPQLKECDNISNKGALFFLCDNVPFTINTTLSLLQYTEDTYPTDLEQL